MAQEISALTVECDEKLKLAVLSAHSSPLGRAGEKDTGGMSTYLRELARALGRQGHFVDLFTRVSDNPEGETVIIGPGARLIHLPAGQDALTKLELYPHMPEFAANLEGFRAGHGLLYDAIFSHYWLSGCAARILARIWGVPHLIMFHTLGAVKNACGSGDAEPPLRIKEESALARECDHIVTAAESEKRELIRRCGAASAQVSVIPCGVDLELFRPIRKGIAREKIAFAGDRMILYVGRIEPVKGIDLIIRALGCLTGLSGLRLVIAGGDEHSRDEAARLKRLARELGVEQAVAFCGAVEHEMLPYYYSAADLTLIASHYESFGLVALESLACGTPVVATAVGDLKTIIRAGETGYVVDSRRPDELAERINLCLQQTAQRSPEKVRDSVSGFSWPRIASRVAAVCRKTIELSGKDAPARPYANKGEK